MSEHRSKAKGVVAEDEGVTIGGKQLLPSLQDKSRRERYTKRFDTILEAIISRKTTESSPDVGCYKEVPTLQVGYVARAMGLNLSNEQVLRLVEMVEESNAMSSGFVLADPLKEVLVEALMTGVMSAPRVLHPPPSRKNPTSSPQVPPPIFVVRDSEEMIYQAFSALDIAKRGYLEADELRHFLCTGNEPFTNDEVEDMIAAAADPVSGRIFYEEFADVLATE